MFAKIIDGVDGKRYVHIKKSVRMGRRTSEEHVGSIGEFDPVAMEQLAYSLLKKARAGNRT